MLAIKAPAIISPPVEDVAANKIGRHAERDESDPDEEIGSSLDYLFRLLR